MYYCNKCNSIPLLFIIPNLNGSEVLKECLCGKEKLDIVKKKKKKNESNSKKEYKIYKALFFLSNI